MPQGRNQQIRVGHLISCVIRKTRRLPIMARTMIRMRAKWKAHCLLVVNPQPLMDRPRANAEPKASSGGLFSKMRGALSKTRQALSTDIRDLFKAEGRLVDDDFLKELFSRLIRTDMGVASAEAIRDDVATRLRARVVSLEEVLETITQQTQSMLMQESAGIQYTESGPP